MIRYRTTWTLLCQIVMCWGLINISCKRPEKPASDYRDYYFPLDSIPAEGMRYVYQNLRDPSGPTEEWRHRQIAENRLESLNMDMNGDVVQKQYDQIVSNGVITDSLVLFYSDSLGNRSATRVKIHSPHRFPFVPGDSTNAWLTHLEWWQPMDSLHVVLQRRRYFLSDTIWKWNGQSYPAVRFKTKDTFETERDGWTTSEWTGEEWYAQSLGLVYYRRDVSSQLVLEFTLSAIEK